MLALYLKIRFQICALFQKLMLALYLKIRFQIWALFQNNIRFQICASFLNQYSGFALYFKVNQICALF